MTISLDELLSQINVPGGMDRVMERTRSPARREALGLCAAVRSFDRVLYESVIKPAIKTDEAPPFENVMTWNEIKRTDASEYAVAEPRGWMLKGLDPAQLADFTKSLVLFCEQAGASRRNELIYQLLVSEPPRGRQLFVDDYKNADAHFDLPRCQELLTLALERYDRLDDDARSLVDDRRAFLRARNFWKDEYYRSLLYLARPAVDTFMETLLGSSSQWIGNLHAKGGRGKTAAIRSLIARTCVPRRIPVARVDFDFIDPGSRPTTFLLQIIKQLEEQIPGTPFNDQRRELSDYESSVTSAPPYTDPFVREHANRFATTIREVLGQSPSLLIFDTIEEVMFGRGGDVLALIDLFSSAHDEAPSIRLLLSGRHSIFEPGRTPGIEPFRAVTVDEEIGPFSDPEARDYLLTRRGVKDSPGIATIVSSSAGLPFALALFADLVRDDPDVSVDELAAGGSVELTYLILRIVRRLKDPRLQWVLRYGVVARKLTLAFVRDVMAPYLPAAMSGPTDLDEPLKNLPEALRDDVFQQNLLGPADTIKIETLWSDLNRYAADQSRSWVSADRFQPDTLVFHAEVLRPMRRLLRDNPVFRLLHQEAAAYFDTIGDAREAVYHRFQIASPDAESYWRSTVERAIRNDRPEEVRDLARELTRFDVDDESSPSVDSMPAVASALQLEALATEARALLNIARRASDATNPAWRQAAQAAGRARKLLGVEELPGDLCAIDAAVLLNAGDAVGALRVLEGATALDDPSRLNVMLLQGAARALVRVEAEAIAHWNDAKRIAEGLGLFTKRPSAFPLEWPRASIEPLIISQLTYLYVAGGRYDAALSELEHALQRARAREDTSFASALLLRTAEVKIELRMPDAAMIAIDHVPAGQDRVRCQLLRAEAELMRFAPLDALELCEAAEGPKLGSGAAGPVITDLGQLAAIIHMRARILTRMMEIPEARIEFQRAVSYYRAAGQRGRTVACLADAAEAELYEFQDGQRANDLISQMGKAVETNDDAGQFRLALLLARSAGNLSLPHERAKTARQRIDSAIVRMAVEPLAAAEELREELSGISPPPARLAVVAELCRNNSVNVPREVATSILNLLTDPRSRSDALSGLTGDDRAIVAMPLIDAYRVFNYDSKAESLLAWSSKRLARPDRPLFDRARLGAERRLGIRHTSRRSLPERWKKHLAGHPDFVAVLLVEESLQGSSLAADTLFRDAKHWARSFEVRDWIDRHTLAVGALAIDNEVDELLKGDQSTNQTVIAISVSPSGGISRVTTVPNQPPATRSLPTLDSTPAGFSRSGQLISYDAVKRLVGDPNGFLDRLESTIIDPLLQQAGRPFDVRLEIDDASLQAYPWELVFERTWTWRGGFVRSLYRASRGATTPALAFPRRNLKVLVLRRSLRTELIVQRGHFRPLETIYEQESMNVSAVEDPSFDQTFDSISKQRPDIVHIAASVGESPSVGGAFLEFASRDLESAAGAPQNISPGVLVQALMTRDPDQPGPVVILDVTRPVGETELVRQMLVRNLLAGELFRSNAVSAIIATGLAPQKQSFAICDLIAQGLGRGQPCGEIVNRVRRLSRPGAAFIDNLPTSGVVLFSRAPDLETT